MGAGAGDILAFSIARRKGASTALSSIMLSLNQTHIFVADAQQAQAGNGNPHRKLLLRLVHGLWMLVFIYTTYINVKIWKSKNSYIIYNIYLLYGI